jgi:hypothetical protein
VRARAARAPRARRAPAPCRAPPRVALTRPAAAPADARRSAAGAAFSAVVLLPWTLTFLLGGARAVGDATWSRLAVTQWAPASGVL